MRTVLKPAEAIFWKSALLTKLSQCDFKTEKAASGPSCLVRVYSSTGPFCFWNIDGVIQL